MPTIHPVSTAHNHDGVYAPIGSTGGITVEDEGTALTARATINFTGDGVSAADDAVNERTNVTITGGGVTDHGALTGLADDDHPQYVKHSLATAVSDFLVASGAGAFVKKTLAEVKTILGLGSMAYTNVDGWIPVSATWTYASATTITVPSGAAAIYKVGQGIKLNNTDTKYFYIVGVADTVLTITGGSDYTLDSDAISAVSYTNTPGTAIGFPVWFAWTPLVHAGAGAITSYTIQNAKFTVTGKLLSLNGQFTITDKGTASAALYFRLPLSTVNAIVSPARYGTNGLMFCFSDAAWGDVLLFKADGTVYIDNVVYTLTASYEIA